MNGRMLDESYGLTTKLFDIFWANRHNAALAERLWRVYQRADDRHWRRVTGYFGVPR